MIARDRSTEYARAALLGAPAAEQIVDRWHLLTIVRDMLVRWLARTHARLRCLPLCPGIMGAAPANALVLSAFGHTAFATAAESRAR